MKIVCVKYIPNWRWHQYITIGKTYTIIRLIKDYYHIKGDDDVVRWIPKEYFSSLEDWRDQQLNKIIL